jgi:glycosyltransferase involved in cell wall biosynthesis
MLSRLAIRHALRPRAANSVNRIRLTVASQDKLITVITPVYNGAPYLQECITSVLEQTYGNFEYFIVDNCSTDASLEIARAAAAADSRITVVQCDEHVGPIQNWNRSLADVGDDSEYIKFVHADDWLFPTCIARMVELADQNENVGIVSAHRLEEDRISLDKLPEDAPLVPGRDNFTMDGRSVASAILLERAYVVGSPTSFLLRTRLVRGADPFFATDFLHADKEACLRLLQECEFGFVRQVLTYTRRHNEAITSLMSTLDSRRQENLLLLEKYGPVFLSNSEFLVARQRELRGYYQFLARNVGTGKGSDFWASHKNILDKAGSPFEKMRLARTFLGRWLNPRSALKEFLILCRKPKDRTNS